MRPKLITLKPFGREWWAAWHADVAKGRPVGFLSDQARRGVGRTVKAADRPCGAGSAVLVPVSVDGEAFDAWSAHFLARGIRLPKPSRAAVIWMPSAMPVDAAA